MESLLSRFANFSPERMQDVGPGPFLVLLVASVLSSLVVTVLYQRFYSSRETGSEVYLSFPLLGLSVTAIFITIQFSLPLSLGLLGALSIVRFRTAIKAPEEIGFIMLLVACSLACATFNLLLLGMMLVVAWLTLVLRRFLPGGRSAEGSGEASLLLTVPAAAWASRVGAHPGHRAAGAGTLRGGKRHSRRRRRRPDDAVPRSAGARGDARDRAARDGSVACFLGGLSSAGRLVIGR